MYRSVRPGDNDSEDLEAGLELEDDDEPISLGLDGSDEDWLNQPDLGPDERDRDLMDGSWEQRRHGRGARQVDWNGVFVGLSLLALLGILIPALAVVLR